MKCIGQIDQATNDKEQVEPMLKKIQNNPEGLNQPQTWLADTGYYSEKNVAACVDAKIEPMIAVTCDHHVKLLRHALNLAAEWGMLEKNPIARVHLFNDDNKVEHYLNETELARLLAVLTTRMQFPTCQVALFLVATGARLNEALQAKWSQIDRVNRVWRIPASNSKSKHIRSIPLNDSAIDLLGKLDTENQFDFLFINRKTGLPPVYIQKYWERVRIDANLPKLRLHDLRHQYASMLINSGRSLFEVQNILESVDIHASQMMAAARATKDAKR